jgi:trehalose 6-phosphate synthase/phosphatase
MERKDVINRFKNAFSRLVVLDYDGTIVDFAPTPDKAIPSADTLLVLNNLTNIPKTTVAIITGRRLQEIDKLLGHLPLNFIAEHGATSKENGEWISQITNDPLWKNKVLPLLHKITMTCPNSFVEEKHFCLTWHYRNAEANAGEKHSKELIRLLENFTHSYNLKTLEGNKAVEIMSKETSKGKATQKLINIEPYDCILCMGDDRTDEDMFETLLPNPGAITIKIGEGETLAKHRLESVQEAILLLKELSI